MVSVLSSSVVDCGFEPLLGQVKVASSLTCAATTRDQRLVISYSG